ncbi:Rossmann-fold NAD(P)-binding domain-containing protein [Deminuibacter soli]|uniref:Epimerase n=1 Tax=Deminuibacter soli TaxID=2291815 RepID=A0A3E1NNV4_9BACT|nr:epimerase [Deminuibacter soli]RFM29577.1 epimerase [Deminuibacter soli]
MKVIITGTTGMVGEGVLLECLANQQITEVLSVSRKLIGIKHPKLKEYIVPDFLSLKENDENLTGYDACFFCAGVSSVGMKESEYARITYDTTLAFAKALNPKSQMTFAYISGAGTDSSEKGRLMWARVKGKTENDLMKLPFKQVFAFRPGAMKYTEGQKNLSKMNKFLSWLYPAFNTVFPNTANTVRQLGQAMIYAAQNGYEKKVVEVSDIKILADKASK